MNNISSQQQQLQQHIPQQMQQQMQQQLPENSLEYQQAQQEHELYEGFQNSAPELSQDQNTFTTKEQFGDCQNNFVGGEENQTNQIQTWKNEMGPQGLSLPVGGSDSTSLPAPF